MISLSNIHKYSQNGNLDGLNALIAQGTNVNETGFNCWGTLQFTCWNGRLNVVKVLLGVGAEVNKTTKNNNGSTPLHMASIWGQFDVVKV